jgi:hypothetical protein
VRQAPFGGASLATATTGVFAGQRGGGCETRSREGLSSVLRRSSHRRLGHAATGGCRGPVARPAQTATVPGAVLTRPNGCHITATVRLLLVGGRHSISWSHRGDCGGRSLVGQGVGGAHHGRGSGAWSGNEATIDLRPDTSILIRNSKQPCCTASTGDRCLGRE